AVSAYKGIEHPFGDTALDDLKPDGSVVSYLDSFFGRDEEWGTFDKVLVARHLAQDALDDAAATDEWKEADQAFEKLLALIDGKLKEPPRSA
ncbi:MAG TPA: hypothetical protein VFB90_08105, partial [Dehalococcoidia bacterium]|nr:hypothetical protein [Dehalococcoidia bacterium]